MSDFWIDEIVGESVIRTWDKLQLGPWVFPGLCQIEPSVALGVDVAKFITNQTEVNDGNPAKFEARLVDKGYDPGTIRATLAIWDSDQWIDLQDLLPKFSPVETSKVRDAWDISHPATKLLGIRSVIIKKVSIRHPVAQTLFVDFDMLQWFPTLKNKAIRPNGGALSATQTKVGKPKAPTGAP